MSRSLHTQKMELRAARRLSRPFAGRQADARLLDGRSGEIPASETVGRRIPLTTQRPLPGLHHALHPRDIHRLLAFLGPSSLYGIRRIQQRSESAITSSGIVFGEYLVPGVILLYAVPASPWRLPFLLEENDLNSFIYYGCVCATDEVRETTTLEWRADGLRDYTLYEVLAHELGHHQLQYHKGKRKAQICRRSDHEKRADLQTRRALRRLQWGAAGQ